MAKEVSKSQKARDYRKQNPGAAPGQISKALGISYSAVYQALNKSKGGKTKEKSAPPPDVTTKSDSGVEHALDFIEKVGSLTEAESLLKRFKAVKR